MVVAEGTAAKSSQLFKMAGRGVLRVFVVGAERVNLFLEVLSAVSTQRG